MYPMYPCWHVGKEFGFRRALTRLWNLGAHMPLAGRAAHGQKIVFGAQNFYFSIWAALKNQLMLDYVTI